MKSRRILYISQEIFPYLPESDVSLTARRLPQVIQEAGNDIRIFMPRFGVINERRNQLHEVIRLSGINMIINNNDHPLIIKVASLPTARLQVYFIDNDDFFRRKSLFGSDPKGENDNDERSIFFVRGALETIKKLRWIPDIIHCHGTFTALGMLYLKKFYNEDPCLKKAKLVFSIYNEAEPVEMPERLYDTLKFDKIKPAAVSSMQGKVDYTALNRLAIHYAHGVVQGSAELSPELHEYIQERGTHFLPYPGKEFDAEIYNEFYKKILP
jgi:glycogen synthase-like protein